MRSTGQWRLWFVPPKTLHRYCQGYTDKVLLQKELKEGKRETAWKVHWGFLLEGMGCIGDTCMSEVDWGTSTTASKEWARYTSSRPRKSTRAIASHCTTMAQVSRSSVPVRDEYQTDQAFVCTASRAFLHAHQLKVNIFVPRITSGPLHYQAPFLCTSMSEWCMKIGVIWIGGCWFLRRQRLERTSND